MHENNQQQRNVQESDTMCGQLFGRQTVLIRINRQRAKNCLHKDT